MGERESVSREESKAVANRNLMHEQRWPTSKHALIQAKYKVVKVDYGEKEEMLHYCFNCAIPLVKQGFTVQELNQIDRR